MFVVLSGPGRITTQRLEVDERKEEEYMARQIKLLVNKPQYLTFLCKKWIRLLTRFLEVPYQDGSSETLS